MTVLTSSVRLARHLRWRVGIDRKQAGPAAWQTPDIIELPKWLKRCWEQSLVTNGAAGQRVLLNSGQFRHVARGIIDELAGNHPLGGGVERLVCEARAITGHWQIGVHDLRRVAASPDTEFFATWAERFVATCRERNWVDEAGLTELVLPELGQGLMPGGSRIVLAGFQYPTALEARLFARLDELGLLAGSIEPPRAESTKRIRIECDDPASELRAAAQWARARVEAKSDHLIGIVVPGLARVAATYRRSFLDAFDPRWREREGTRYPISVVDATKLADTELGRTALLLLRVPGGKLDYREVGRLLRSPYVGGWDGEAAERARFDLRLREDCLQQVDLRTLRKRHCTSEEPGPKSFLDIIEALLRPMEQMSGRHDPGSWVEFYKTLLQSAQFCRGRALSQHDKDNLEAWGRSIERFASLGEVTGRINYRRALNLLSDTASQHTLNLNERDDGVHILAPGEATGLRFDGLWLGGMTSAAWPGEPGPSPLIPLSLQRARAIPEAVPKLYRQRALSGLRALFIAAPECVASCPSHDGEEALVSSPQISGFDVATLADIGIELPEKTYRESFLYDGGLSQVEDPPPLVGHAEKIRGGSRLLNLQSVCPARAFFELRLGAAEMVKPPFALDAATRGKIAHDAAEYFYAAFLNHGGPLVASQTALEEKAGAAIERALARHLPPMHPLIDTLRNTERVRLERLLRNLVERDRKRGAVNLVELEDRHQIEVGGLELTVQFDRVDASGEGARLVIDYKTGSKFGAAKWIGERPLEMQLPLYAAYGNCDGIALYWLHARELSITGMGTDDWGINAGTGHGRKSFKVLDADEWQQQLMAWRASCEQLITEFRAGDCRIDLLSDTLAAGEYAMVTRRWALDPSDEEPG